jgi:hypothetical protein
MRLLRTILIVGLSSTPFVSLLAQDPKPTQSSRLATVGILAGMSLTTLAGKDAADDLERRTRPLAGVFVVIDLATRIQLEIDALYSAKGFRSPGTTSHADFSLGYLELPALLRVNLAPNSRVQPFIAAGAAFGYRVACDVSTVTPTISGSLGCDDVVVSDPLNVSTTDFSGVLGAGVDILAGPARFTLATRFTRGFTSVFDGRKNHNEAFSIYVGVARAKQYF